MNRRVKPARLQHPLPVLAGLLVAFSVAFFPLSRGSIRADLPQVILPLGVSLGIALYSIRLLQADYDVERVRRIAVFGWAGVFIASVGFWLLSQQLLRESPVALLFDEALTVLSVGSGIGVVVGAHAVHEYHSESPPDRARVLTETVWTSEPGPNPVLTAVTTQMAELEGVDPRELEPLYEHINPDVFAELQAQGDSQWQLLFYTDDYEIRVSGQGTVTIYDTSPPDERVDVGSSQEEYR